MIYLLYRRSSHKNLRRRREDEQTMVSRLPVLQQSGLLFSVTFNENLQHVPSKVWFLTVTKNLQKTSSATKDPPSPKFDLEASSFPPLPGCVECIQGETTQEMRLSDIVRGLKVANKVEIVSNFNISYTRSE